MVPNWICSLAILLCLWTSVSVTREQFRPPEHLPDDPTNIIRSSGGYNISQNVGKIAVIHSNEDLGLKSDVTDSNLDSTDTSSLRSRYRDFRRNRRAPKEIEFNFKVEKVAMLARVLTAISLQNGLIDGSIPGDEAVAELLNIGSVKMDDVEKFDKVKVDTFLKNLEHSKKMNVASKYLETGIIVMKEMGMRWSKIVGLDKLPDSQAFDELDSIMPVDLSVLNTTVKPAVNYLLDIPNLPEDAATNWPSLNSAVDMITNIRNSLMSLEAIFVFLKSLNDPKVHWKTLVKFSNEIEPLSPFGQLVKLMVAARPPNFNKFMADEKEALEKNIETITGLVFKSGEFGTMNAVSSRFFSQPLKHMNGFVNGHLDLNMISDDSTNPWLVETLATQLPIREGLAKLKQLGESVGKVDETWEKTSSRGTRIGLKRIIQLQAKSGELQVNPQLVGAAIQAFGKCTRPDTSQRLEDSLSLVMEQTKILVKTMKSFDSMFELVTEEHTKNLQEFRVATKLSADPSKYTKEVPEVIANMKHFSGTQKTIELIQRLEPLLRDVSNITDIIHQVKSNKDLIIKFSQTEDIKNLQQFFSCLNTVNSETDSISNAVVFITKLRDFQGTDQVIADIQKVSTKISASLPSVESLRSIPGILRNEPTREMKELLKLEDLKDYSKLLGEAVFIVTAIQKAMKKKSTFEELLGQLAVVDQEIDGLVDERVKEDVKDKWGDSGETTKAVEEMLRQLAEKTNSTSRVKRDLSGFDTFFSSLAGIKNVNLVAEERLEALDKLVAADPALAPKLTDVRNTLEDLGALDLQFSRHDSVLAGMRNTLAEIQRIFASLKPTPVPIPVQKPGENRTKINSMALGKTSTVVAEDGGVPIWVYVLVGVLVLLVVVVGLVVCYRRYLGSKVFPSKKQGTKIDNGKLPDESPGRQPPAPPASAPPASAPLAPAPAAPPAPDPPAPALLAPAPAAPPAPDPPAPAPPASAPPASAPSASAPSASALPASAQPASAPPAANEVLESRAELARMRRNCDDANVERRQIEAKIHKAQRDLKYAVEDKDIAVRGESVANQHRQEARKKVESLTKAREEAVLELAAANQKKEELEAEVARLKRIVQPPVHSPDVPRPSSAPPAPTVDPASAAKPGSAASPGSAVEPAINAQPVNVVNQ